LTRTSLSRHRGCVRAFQASRAHEIGMDLTVNAFGNPPGRARPPTSAGQNDAVVWSKANTTTRNRRRECQAGDQPEQLLSPPPGAAGAPRPSHVPRTSPDPQGRRHRRPEDRTEPDKHLADTRRDRSGFNRRGTFSLEPSSTLAGLRSQRHLQRVRRPDGNATGSDVPTQLTFVQNNRWADNVYRGPSTFYAGNQGNLHNPLSWSDRTRAAGRGTRCTSEAERKSGAGLGPFRQDAGSSFTSRRRLKSDHRAARGSDFACR
jgi:hypothetical protein